MWFIADLFERYTSNVARTFIKLAALEAEASQRTLEDLRARRKRQVIRRQERALRTRAPMVHPRTGEPLTAESGEPGTLARPEGAAGPAARGASDPGDHLRARVRAAFEELPMGVRGEVVVRYVDALTSAGQDEIADLLERLRKDKKVRVAELQIIASAVLDEEPTMRKKADHIAALRRHLLAPWGRPSRAGADIHAAYPAE